MGLREKAETFVLRMMSRPGQASDFRRKIVEEAEISQETRVIDMATAVGGMAFAAAEKSHHVTAIDVSEERIKIAGADPRANDINFRVVDAAHTDFSDKEFDVAIIVLGLHEMTVPGAESALVEARRIARKLVVVEFGFDKWPYFWRVVRYALAIFEPKGFFAFTKISLSNVIGEAGWKINKELAKFPFVTYICT